MENVKFGDFCSAFPTRLRRLLSEKNMSRQALSQVINVSRQAISQYCDGSTIPNADKLAEIANYFNVSTDYLIGNTETRTPDTTIQAICEYTGLDETVIETLHANLIFLKKEETYLTPKSWIELSFEIANLFLKINFFYSADSLSASLDEYIMHIDRAQKICNSSNDTDNFRGLLGIYNNYNNEKDLADLRKYQMVNFLTKNLIERITEPYSRILNETTNQMTEKLKNKIDLDDLNNNNTMTDEYFTEL